MFGRSSVSTFWVIPEVCVLLVCELHSQSPAKQVSVTRLVGVDYPWFARVAGVHGDVELAITLSQEGKVESVRVVSGPEPLRRAAVESMT